MTATNTLTLMNGYFKHIVDKAQELIPENAVMMRLVPEITEATRLGRDFLVPAQLSMENGITYGDDTAFSLNASVAATFAEAVVQAYPVVIQTQISESLANRLANSKQAFMSMFGLRSEVILQSLSSRMEISMLLGQSGIGTTSTTSSNVNTTTETVVLTTASWAPGIWSAAQGAVVQFYNGSTLISSGTDSQFSITGVSNGTTTLTVTGSSTGITALNTAITAGPLTVYFLGAYGTEMLGLDAQISNGGTNFGINSATYPLWKGQSFDCKNASLTMQKVLAGEGECVGVGGLNSDAVLMCSAATYNNLNSDQAALRSYDESYDPKNAENGTSGIKYKGASGATIEVMVNNICPQGVAYLVPKKHLKRIGARDVSFNQGSDEGAWITPIPGYAGYSLRAGAEFSVFLERPAQACKFINIVNS